MLRPADMAGQASRAAGQGRHEKPYALMTRTCCNAGSAQGIQHIAGIAAAGNFDCAALQAARKVYGTLLASLPGMPQAYVRHAPPMVLACARAELAQGAKDSQQRALHALLWLGCSGPYERFKPQEKGTPAPWSSDRWVWACAGCRGYEGPKSVIAASIILESPNLRPAMHLAWCLVAV